MKAIEQSGFDYESLGSANAKFVRGVTAEIRERMGKAAQNVFEIGSRLIEVKEKLAHGQFGEWLEAEFGWGHSTAAKMMQVASKFPHCGNLKIAPSALYLLASNEVDDDTRNEFIERAEKGEAITHAEVKRAVSKTVAREFVTQDGEVLDAVTEIKTTSKTLRSKEADPNEDAENDALTDSRSDAAPATKTRRTIADEANELVAMLEKPPLQWVYQDIRKAAKRIAEALSH